MKQSDTKKALFIGINDYHKKPLRACISDADEMQKALAKHADGKSNFTPISRPNLTGANLRHGIEKFLKDRASDHGLIFFSGHGYVDETDGYLVGKDFAKDNIGASMSWLVDQINASEIKEITIILDCCHAGELGNRSGAHHPIAQLRKNVTILAATTEDDVAQEGRAHGFLTEILLKGLNGAAADILGNVSAAGLYDLADTMLSPFHQRPVFKSFVTQMSPLKKCKSDMDEATLHKLVARDFFENPKKRLQLYPEYIALDISQQKKVAYFSNLSQFQKAGLLACDDQLTLYEAALRSKSCSLSSYGLFIHEMISKGRI